MNKFVPIILFASLNTTGIDDQVAEMTRKVKGETSISLHLLEGPGFSVVTGQ